MKDHLWGWVGKLYLNVYFVWFIHLLLPECTHQEQEVHIGVYCSDINSALLVVGSELRYGCHTGN